MNKVWMTMILAGIASYGARAWRAISSPEGSADDAGFMHSLLDSCEEAVYFVIGLAGIMGLWSGFMNIARGSGLIHAMAMKSRRMMRFLFDDDAHGFYSQYIWGGKQRNGVQPAGYEDA